MLKQSFKQTGILVRFIVRQDRVRIPIWIISLLLITLQYSNFLFWFIRKSTRKTSNSANDVKSSNDSYGRT